MQKAKNLSEYNDELREALDNTFLRGAMDKFATAYPVGRANAFREYDVEALIQEVVKAKDAGLTRPGRTLCRVQGQGRSQRRESAHGQGRRRGQRDRGPHRGRKQMQDHRQVQVHDGRGNPFEPPSGKDGLEVVETDLGEWIIQLRHEGPSHMVMPAIHLSRYQVAELFSQVTKHDQSSDIQRLVKVARRELRQKYADADMGVSGANFAIAETGTIGLMTNEGNARLVTTLPRVHVAIAGIDKLCGTLDDALKILRVVPKNATGQAITSYVTWISGANECQTAPGGKKEMHIIFLDNGRSEMAKDPLFAQVLRCVRCGACANVCPVYRMVGGHQMGHIYIGAIGLILTYFFHGKDKAKNLVQNCINCQACKHICAAGIDLPLLIKEIHARILDEDGHPLPSMLLGKLLKNRKLFHAFLRTAKMAQRPLTGGTQYIRHLPHIFSKDHGFKALPAIAAKPFRDRFAALKPTVSAPKFRIALFSGCVQDFVYPEQLEAAVKVLAAHNVAVDFPMDQSCCGLPLQMMGEKKAGVDVAKQNIAAMSGDYDYIITLCASCASHLKHNYPFLLGENDAEAKAFADKVMPFSAFMTDVLGVTADGFKQTHERATLHAPCHLCRGMGVVEQPRQLLALGGYEYAQAEQEQVCCGFGGTYSAKFPGISEQILKNKLTDAGRTGAEVLVTECPGCIMQLRGGAEVNKSGFAVRHIAEVLADHLK